MGETGYSLPEEISKLRWVKLHSKMFKGRWVTLRFEITPSPRRLAPKYTVRDYSEICSAFRTVVERRK